MKKPLLAACALLVSICSAAQAPAILVDACNQMQPASKRPECLRAAEGRGGIPTGASKSSNRPLAAYGAPKSGGARSVSGTTCYTGPRGGTYTITGSGRKNYSGCWGIFAGDPRAEN